MDILAYKHFLKREYPSAYEFLQTCSIKPVFFPEPVVLPLEAYQRISQVAQSLFQLKSKKDYPKSLSAIAPATAFKEQSQSSVLMAYDFHIVEGEPKLIEVNTNGSGFLLVNSLYQFKNRPYKEAKESLRRAFQSEWAKFNEDSRSITEERPAREKSPALKAVPESKKAKAGQPLKTGGKILPPRKVILIDEDPLNQKMALEFFMYKDFFQSLNWPFEICDSRSLKADDKGRLYTAKGERVDFIYNRSVDFYFENHPLLAAAYLKGACAVSPNPREYYLLSDKDRLCEWAGQRNTAPELEPIRRHIPFSEILNFQNKDRAWANRKKYFFKIRQGHGGKAVYKGASLTRKKFDELVHLKSLIQEFIPPSRTLDSQGNEWKTDFRAYAYEDQIQQFTARCYKGQVTNFREENSGFAVVQLV